MVEHLQYICLLNLSKEFVLFIICFLILCVLLVNSNYLIINESEILLCALFCCITNGDAG